MQRAGVLSPAGTALVKVSETDGVEEFLIVFRTTASGLGTGGEIRVMREEGVRSLLTSHGWSASAIDVSLRTARGEFSTSRAADVFQA